MTSQFMASKIRSFFPILIVSASMIFLSVQPLQAGSLVGRVTAKISGVPLAGIVVEVIALPMTTLTSCTSDPNGRYTCENIPEGEYLIRASAGDSGYISEYYQSAPDYYTAKLIYLTTDQQITGLDFQLKTGQSISGFVTDQETGLPVQGIGVIVFSENSIPLSSPYSSFSSLPTGNYDPAVGNPFMQGKSVVTGTNGRYEIKGLPLGRYLISAGGDQRENIDLYIPEFFEDESNSSIASLVPVTELVGAHGIDMQLTKGGGISGRVADTSGMGIAGVVVRAEQSTPWMYSYGGTDGLGSSDEAMTDSNGRYAMRGLIPGTFRVSIGSQTYGSPANDSMVVDVTKGAEATGRDFTYSTSGKSITGHVSSAMDGSPVKGMSVVCAPLKYPSYTSPYTYPYGYGGYYGSYYGGYYGGYPNYYGYETKQGITGTTGAYLIEDIDAGQYIIQTVKSPFSRGDLNRYIEQVYTVSGRKAPVYLLPSQFEVSGIDFSLVVGGSITGTVTNRLDGSPIQSIMVMASPPTTYNPYYYSSLYYPDTGYQGGFAFTDKEGKYRIDGLDQGGYRVTVIENNGAYTYGYPAPYPPPSITDYIDPAADTFNYYNYGFPWQDPRFIWIDPPEEITGIDFELIKGGSISGVVRAQYTGVPLPSVQIMAIRIYNPPSTYTQSGYYGTASAYSSNMGYGYYGNAYYGGYYGGYYGENYVYSTTTDMNGAYSIKGLYEGEYELSAYDLKNSYMSPDEKVIQLEEGQALFDQNFSMQSFYSEQSGGISGTITNEADGSPIPNIWVTAQRFSHPGIGGEPVGDSLPYPSPWMDFPSTYYPYYTGYGDMETQFSAITDTSGHYCITGLPPGEYMVTCTTTEREYMRECYAEIPGINLSNLQTNPLIRMTREVSGLGEDHPYLQVKFQAIHAFNLHLVLRDKQGREVPALIKLGQSGPNTCEGLYLGDGWCHYSNDYDIDNEEDSWGVLEIELDELLMGFYADSACFSVGPAAPTPDMGLDSLVSIGFEGNGFSLDYIRLQDTDSDTNDRIYIDGFNYSDGPSAHGWQITSPFTPDITVLAGEILEGGKGIRVLAETPVQVAADSTTEGIDLALSGGERVSGRVTDGRDGQPLSGAMICLFRIDRFDAYLYDDAYNVTTDSNGVYDIGGIRPGTYSVLAEGPEGSELMMQWYDTIQPVIEEAYQGYYIGYGLSDLTPVFSLKKSGITGYTNSILEFMALASDLLSLSLDVLTASEKEVKIRFHNTAASPESGLLSNTILVPISTNGPVNQIWRRMRFDLNEILEEHLQDQFQQVTGVCLRGRCFLIDYIKLTQQGYADQVIDDFSYQTSPLENGWTSDRAIGFKAVNDPLLGHACLLLSAVTPISIDEGSTKTDIDFSIMPYGSISGLVTDEADGSSIPGIQLTTIVPDTAYTPYGYNTQTLSEGNGRYILEGLIPGQYRVQACDPEGFYMPLLYKDIEVAVQLGYSPSYYYTTCQGGFNCTGADLALLTRDLTSLDITNTTIAIDLLYNGQFGTTLQIETADGASLELRFQTDSAGPEGWIKEWDEEAHTGVLSIDITQETIYNCTQIQGYYGDGWYSWRAPLDEIVAQGFSKTIQGITQITIEGGFFRIASIRFLREGEPEQVVDAFEYSDSPENHGWVTGRPATTHPVMVWEPLIEEGVLECSSAELINVEEGVTTMEIDFHLRRGNRVIGRVTDASDGTPLAGIRVYAETEEIRNQIDDYYMNYYSSSMYYPYYPYYYPAAEAYTDQDGRYNLLIGGSSEPQNYYIEARDEVRHVYCDVSYPSPLELGHGTELTDIDIGMKKGGIVSGKATFFATEIPAKDAIVECRVYYAPPVNYPNYYGYYGGYSYTTTDPGYQYGGGESYGGYSYGPYPYPRYRTVASTRADSEGNYRITGLLEGGYVIYAQSNDLLFEGYYRDSRDYLDPPFVESSEETAGMDILLYPKRQGNIYSVPYQGNYYASQTQYGAYQGSYSGGGMYGQGYGGTSYAPQTQQNTQGGPAITSKPGQDAFVGELYTYQVSIEDPNKREEVQCRLIEAPAGMTVDGKTWLIQWTPTLGQVGDHLVRVGIDASEGGVSRQDFPVHVYPYMVIESAEGEESPLLKGEWGIVRGSGSLTGTNDTEMKSPVMRMQTSEEAPLNFRVRYPLGDALGNPRPYLCFAVKCVEDFRFSIEVVLGGSPYTLIYAPIGGDWVASGTTLFYPIGSEYKDGLWHLCTRDLRKDLSMINAPFESVSSFEIWGDCRIDDIRLSYQPIDYSISTIRIYPGLNLISLPVQMSQMDSAGLAQLFAEASTSDVQVRRRNAYLGRWEDAFDMVRDDQGYLLYSPDEFSVTFKGDQKKQPVSSLHTFLKAGTNLICPPPADGNPYQAAGLLMQLRSYRQNIQGIRMYDQEKGQWRSRVQFFGGSSGPDFEIRQGQGYMIDLGE